MTNETSPTIPIVSRLAAAVRVAVGPGPAALPEPRFVGNEWLYLKDCLDSTYVCSVGKFVRVRPLCTSSVGLVLQLVGDGISNNVMALDYMPEVIRSHFEVGGRFGCRIEYMLENMPRAPVERCRNSGRVQRCPF